MDIYEEIRDRIYDGTTDIFADIQERMSIRFGDVSMMDEIDLDDAISSLAEVMARCIKNQMGGDEE